MGNKGLTRILKDIESLVLVGGIVGLVILFLLLNLVFIF